jgi:glycosyltransferase involved in cell wall biosynthesis
LFETSSFVLARLVRAVIVKSVQMRQRLRLDSANVIPNGVDTGLFRPADRTDARHILGLDPGKKFVLFPYNPAEARKRYDLVEAAVRLARERIPEIEILQVMQIPQSRMPLYMNAADVMVMASMLEGSPNAVKEALAVNLPVVAVEVGDVAELLHSTEGNHIVAREPEAIAEKIVEVCQSGKRSNSRERIVERLSMERVAERILDVYANVVKPPTALPRSYGASRPKT